MKFLVIAQMSTETTNKAMKDPNFMQTFEDYFNSVKAEAVYLGEVNGGRGMYFVVDVPSVDMMAAIGEPLFQNYDAKVEFKPVMGLEDVKKAMQTLQK